MFNLFVISLCFIRYYYSITLKNKFHKKSFFWGGGGVWGSAFVFFLGAKLLRSFNLRKCLKIFFVKYLIMKQT